MKDAASRTYLAAAIMLAIGAFGLVGSTRAAGRTTEAFMEEKAPTAVEGFSMVAGREGGMRYTYKMDAGTYKVLQPDGIVARQFTDGGVVFDTVLITSTSHESFHDPKICFSAQSWTFNSLREESLEVPGVGLIPLTFVEMSGPRSKAIAAYTYRGPAGIVANPKRLQLDMFREVLLGRPAQPATFYRFMPATEGVPVERLKEFIVRYLVAAKRSSGGFF